MNHLRPKDGKYTQRADGEWFHVATRGHLVACCDCGLVHLFKAKVVNGRVMLSAARSPKHTAARRRAKNISVKRERTA